MANNNQKISGILLEMRGFTGRSRNYYDKWENNTYTGVFLRRGGIDIIHKTSTKVERTHCEYGDLTKTLTQVGVIGAER